MNNTARKQEILHLSQSIALMRSLNNHLLQTRDFNYGLAIENTIDEALFQIDQAMNELDQIRDGYARGMEEGTQEALNRDISSEPSPNEQAMPPLDPMVTMINRNIPALIKRHLRKNSH